MTTVKTFQLFLILQDFVPTQSLITVHLILSGDMNPSPAKVTQHGTWEIKCGLVKKLVKELTGGEFDTVMAIQMLQEPLAQ